MTTPEVRDIRKSQLKDPLGFFPYETFISIICFAISDDPNGPLSLLSVSNRWQSTLLDTPDVWTGIEIDSSKDVVQRTAAFLHLSQNFPIDLRITTPLSTIAQVDPLIQERHRIRTLTVSRWTRNQTVYNSFEKHTITVINTLKHMAKYPYYSQLQETIEESRAIQLPTKLLAVCPKLAIITGSRTDLYCIPSLSRTVSELEYHYEKPSDVDALAQNGFALTSLTLVNSDSAWYPSEYVRASVLKQSASTLRHFTILTLNWHLFLEDFLLRQLPRRLQSLSIHLPTRFIELFVASLQFLSYLTDLTLTLDESNEGNKVYTIPGGESNKWPLLRNLTIYDNTKMTERFGLKSLIHALSGHKCLRGIDRVKLQLRGGFPELSLTIPLLETLTTLRILDVDISHYYGEIYLTDKNVTIRPVLMPSVEELMVCKVDYLHVLHTPNVVRLYIKEFTYWPGSLAMPEGFGGRLSQINADFDSFSIITKSCCTVHKDSPWNNVQDVTWTYWDFSCEIFTASFNSLTSITLPGYNGAHLRQNPINALCLTLLDRSRPCPSLHTICSKSYPYWELLFTVLYDRLGNNDNAKVQPIQELRFPLFPVAFILHSLVNLLKGHAEGLTGGIDDLIRRRISNKNMCVHDSDKLTLHWSLTLYLSSVSRAMLHNLLWPISHTTEKHAIIVCYLVTYDATIKPTSAI